MATVLNQLQKAFEGRFMQPKAYMGKDIESEILEAGLDLEYDKFYCRLSADGYLDCTDWHGPFDTIDDCAQFLIDTYADEGI